MELDKRLNRVAQISFTHGIDCFSRTLKSHRVAGRNKAVCESQQSKKKTAPPGRLSYVISVKEQISLLRAGREFRPKALPVLVVPLALPLLLS